MEDPTAHIYDQIKTDRPFYALVDEFYHRVAEDALIRPMYPDDLAPAREHLALFLVQRFGGPTTYSEQRGHPRLRMRHVHFKIGVAERDAWLTHMNAALDAVPELQPYLPELRLYFQSAADFLVNAEE